MEIQKKEKEKNKNRKFGREIYRNKYQQGI